LYTPGVTAEAIFDVNFIQGTGWSLDELKMQPSISCPNKDLALSKLHENPTITFRVVSVTVN